MTATEQAPLFTLPKTFPLDTASREAGRRGLAKARAALAEAIEAHHNTDPDDCTPAA